MKIFIKLFLNILKKLNKLILKYILKQKIVIAPEKINSCSLFKNILLGFKYLKGEKIATGSRIFLYSK